MLEGGAGRRQVTVGGGGCGSMMRWRWRRRRGGSGGGRRRAAADERGARRFGWARREADVQTGAVGSTCIVSESALLHPPVGVTGTALVSGMLQP